MILVSIFSATNGLTISAPRVYYAMAQDGLFFRKLAEVHPRFGTPAVSIVAGTVWAMVLAASGTFEQLLTYVVFVGWIFYALGAACVFVLRRTRPDAERPFRVPGLSLDAAAVHRRGGCAGRQHDRDAARPRRGRHRRRPARPSGLFRLALLRRIDQRLVDDRSRGVFMVDRAGAPPRRWIMPMNSRSLAGSLKNQVPAMPHHQ